MLRGGKLFCGHENKEIHNDGIKISASGVCVCVCVRAVGENLSYGISFWHDPRNASWENLKK